jgi:hypothetical protein
MDLDPVSTRLCWDINLSKGLCQQKAIIIVTYALVGEQIGGWNVY